MSVPKVIYLQIGGLDPDETDEQGWDSADEITWCTDKVDDRDIEYVLKSEADTDMDALRARAEKAEADTRLSESIANTHLAVVLNGDFSDESVELIEGEIKQALQNCGFLKTKTIKADGRMALCYYQSAVAL